MKNRFILLAAPTLMSMAMHCMTAYGAVPQQPARDLSPPTIAQSADGHTQYLAVQVLPIPRNSKIAADHRACTTDAECTLVQTSCTDCCTQPENMDAVNKTHEAEYADPKVCTPEHIRNCGVPECGLFSPLPTSVAVCHEGHCAVEVHPPEPRTAPPAPEAK